MNRPPVRPARNPGINPLKFLMWVIPTVVKNVGLFAGIVIVVVVLMWRFYNWVWLNTLGYPWAEWLRDHLWAFWLLVLIGSGVASWWMWRSVKKEIETVAPRALVQAPLQGPIRIGDRLKFWAIAADLRDRNRREAFWKALVGQVAATMVKMFFIFGALGFLSGHVVWGGGGVQQGHLAVGSGGELYLTDPKGDSVLVSRPEGPQWVLGDGGADFLQLHTPRGLASDTSTNRLFLVDTYRQRVVIFDPKNPLTNCVLFGRKGTGPGEFQEPSGIVLDEGLAAGARNLYIYDGTKGKVIHFTLDGQDIKFVEEWGWHASSKVRTSSGPKFTLRECSS